MGKRLLFFEKLLDLSESMEGTNASSYHTDSSREMPCHCLSIAICGTERVTCRAVTLFKLEGGLSISG